MRIYIAAHSQGEAGTLKHALEQHGFEVGSRWVLADTKFGQGLHAYTDAERRELAITDEADVRECDALVLLAEPQGRMVPGGKHVETGIALALRKHVYVLGRRENVFHWHPRVTVVSSVPELLCALSRHVASPIDGGQPSRAD